MYIVPLETGKYITAFHLVSKYIARKIVEITRCDSRDSVRRLILHKAFLGIYIYMCVYN